ncbi:MAG: hypothetical protein WBQ57_03855 [Rhodanobacteraceae bacterium]
MLPGEIYRDARFYVAVTGEPKAKYLLVLATPKNDDIVARLLTSLPRGRPETPPCYHGAPYGGYFLGIPGAPLTQETWVDLRYLDDLDPDDFRKRETKGILSRVARLPVDLLREILRCVAEDDDTTRQEDRHLRDAIDALPNSTTC